MDLKQPGWLYVPLLADHPHMPGSHQWTHCRIADFQKQNWRSHWSRSTANRVLLTSHWHQYTAKGTWKREFCSIKRSCHFQYNNNKDSKFEFVFRSKYPNRELLLTNAMAGEYRRKMTDASTGDGAFLTSDAPSKPNNKAGWNNNGAQLKRRMLEDDLKKFPRLENETHNFCSPSWIELNYCRYKNVYENAMLPISWKLKTEKGVCSTKYVCLSNQMCCNRLLFWPHPSCNGNLDI